MKLALKKLDLWTISVNNDLATKWYNYFYAENIKNRDFINWLIFASCFPLFVLVMTFMADLWKGDAGVKS